MHVFERRTAHCIDAHHMAAPGAPILAGVSGGADSVALLHALNRLGYPLFVVHIHHGLRADEADRDEAFVRGLCDTLNLPFYAKRFDVAAIAKQRGISLETAGREVRYACFEQLRQQCGAEHIAVAHTLDDCAETILLHLTRGCGLDGLCGIPPVNGRVIRPIIECSRAEVEDYLAAIDATYVTDSTNAGIDYTRNRVRHLVLPRLKEINPAVSALIARNAASLADDRNYLASQARLLADQCTTLQGDRVTIDLQILADAPPSLQRRVILMAAAQFDGCSLTLPHTDAVLSLDQSGKGLDLPCGVRVRRSYQTLIWEHVSQTTISFCHTMEGSTVFIPETGATVLLEATDTPPAKGELSLDADKLAGKTLLLRSRQPGDKFIPSGMTGRKKLQDFFVDSKIPVDKRDAIPLLTADGEIAAVVGHRTAAPFCASQYTKRYIKLFISGGNYE